MFIEKISPKTQDGNLNVVIEISMHSDPVKYEFDKQISTLVVDRVMQCSMTYPCNYGFIPNTLADDGDPVDVLVMSQYPINSNVLITVRPVGVLIMEDESGMDEKILAVPISKVDITYDIYKDIADIPDTLKQKIVHFFERYKELEKGKWVKIIRWDDANSAMRIVEAAIDTARNQ